MADTRSVLVFNPLHTKMKGSVIEITVAGALTIKPNCCNAYCYLLPKHCAVVRYTRMLQRDRLADLQVTTVRFVLLSDHLCSKLILTTCNKFFAIPFSRNKTLCCKITTKLLSQQCSVRPLCEPEICHTFCLFCCNIYESTGSTVL